MAITNYSELQTAVLNWLSRTGDTNLANRVTECIALAELSFNRELRTRQMETSDTLTPVNGVCTLPNDFLELRRLYINGSQPQELEYLTPENFFLKYPALTQGGGETSRYYTIEGNSILLSDISSGTDVKILYYQEIPALSDSNTSNWLLNKHHDLYLAMTLGIIYGIIKNQAQEQGWLAKAGLIVESIKSSDMWAKYSGSNLRVVSA
jgi:hypothetical protein